MAAYAAKMQAALEEDDRDTSLTLWRDLFGDEFGPTRTAVVKAAEAHRAEAPHDGEQFIDQPPFNYPIQMRPGCSVRILARAEDVIVGGRKLRRGFSPVQPTDCRRSCPQNPASSSSRLRCAVLHLTSCFGKYGMAGMKRPRLGNCVARSPRTVAPNQSRRQPSIRVAITLSATSSRMAAW